jgi:hypothetical protein
MVLVYLNRKTESTPKCKGSEGRKLLGGRVYTDVKFDLGSHLIVLKESVHSARKTEQGSPDA